MLFNAAGDLLLIRNTYGDPRLFVLPGGGIRPREKPEAAVVREVREELGCPVHDLLFVATFHSVAEGKRDTIFLYRGQLGGVPRADEFEVAEARFFPLAALPEAISPATLRRIEEMQGKRPASPVW
jgi:ADP-ribose pyrophosphatase YjhB (NUDIX family)